MKIFALLLLVIAIPAAAQQTMNFSGFQGLDAVEVRPKMSNGVEFTAALDRLYPPHLRNAGVGDTVYLAFVIGEDGLPQNVHVLSVWDQAFGPPSVEALSLARFSPAQAQGRPVAVRVQQRIVWQVPTAAGVHTDSIAERVVEDVSEIHLFREVETLPMIENIPDFARVIAQNYPSALRAAGTGGQVDTRFLVNADGRVSNVTILRTTESAFNEPTRRSLAIARFRPARKWGRPVAVWVEQPFAWTTER